LHLRLIRYSERSKVEILPCPSPVSFCYVLVDSSITSFLAKVPIFNAGG
jgi:hypothetical protein